MRDLESRMRAKNALRRRILAATVAVLAIAALPAAAADAFEAVMEPYEAIRAALVADDIDAVGEPAERLDAALGELGPQMTAEDAGVPAAQLGEVKALLPELRDAAADLAAADDLKSARDAFYALSKPLVRWRQAMDEGPVVVYCSMKKRSWLQRSGEEIGNPYYGQQMARCGEVVSD